MRCEVRVLSALQKVFADEVPLAEEIGYLSLLRNDVTSFQVAYYLDAPAAVQATIEVASALRPWIAVREVKLSPSAYPCHVRRDDDYLRVTPGMFPDRLALLDVGDGIRLIPGQWRAVWVDIEANENTPSGVFPVEISAVAGDGDTVFSARVEIEVIGCVLPACDLYHTEWFHADCLADYYGVSTESDDFFDMVKPFVQLAVKRGVNTLLTPLFTPPLDTMIGGERTTVQLVGVKREKGSYTFDFTRLKRWVAMCEACGVRYFEMAHLFSQWGARYAPKIMGYEEGIYTRFFGWDTPGTGDAYRAFLDAFLPALLEKLDAMGIKERCIFHISDEPGREDMGQYLLAKGIVEEHLKGCMVIDALSEFSFYQTGAVELPVVANDHIEPFLAAGVSPVWTYYCTAQSVDVGNRFFAMPSVRNRILGVQMYRYGVQGFLHWGYNFYNTQHSVRHINPYAVTDAGEAFPSGDAFLVYPGEDGQPEESIRLLVLQAAFLDVAALKLLEGLTSREAVMELLDETLCGRALTFSDYPREEAFLLSLRSRVNQEVARVCKRTEAPAQSSN